MRRSVLFQALSLAAPNGADFGRPGKKKQKKIDAAFSAGIITI
jgi:hypothetical protein